MLKLYGRILGYIVAVILMLCSYTVVLADSEYKYGDLEAISSLEQFKGNKYVVYRNGDTENTELAVIYADDIQNRSIMIERKEQAEIINRYLTSFGTEVSLEIQPIERAKLYMADTGIMPNISKWCLNGDVWQHCEEIYGETICDNTEDLIFSNIPVIEVMKKKMKNSPYPRNFNGISFSEFDADSEGKYILFSDDGFEYNIRVKTPEEDDNKYCIVRESYCGNDRILVMGVNEFENLPEFKRIKGYSNDIMYILNSNYEIIDKVMLSTLRECSGFYNGYFYFYDKDYYENYKYNEYYYKSEDGINLISITKDEYIIVKKQIESLNNSNSLGYIQNSEYNGDIKNPIFQYYLCDVNNRYKIEYERSTTGVGTYSWSESAKWLKILYILQNENGQKRRFVTFDGIYGSVQLPMELSTENTYVMWATDNYVFIDVDRENYYRIPIDEAFKHNAIVRLNDKILGFAQPPIMEDDRTLVPMRFLFEQMGADVEWNAATQTATATISNAAPKGFADSAAAVGLAEQGTATKSKARPLGAATVGEANSVTFSIDNTIATVNGETATMDVPARLINDQTFVPLRFLSENLGYDVEWDEATNTAIITTE